MRQYRKLDDQVVTRLNRAQAQLRDEVRQGKGDSPDGMCAKMWAEMMSECRKGIAWPELGARVAEEATRAEYGVRAAC